MKIPAAARVIVLLVVAVAGAEAAARWLLPPIDESPKMWLGGFVTPGMSEASARAVLDQRYELIRGSGETYYLRVKGAGPRRAEAKVSFHEGKLTRASYNWYQADAGGGDAAAFASAVYDAVRVATQLNDQQPCAVSTEDRQSSGEQIKETDISCGRRTVRVLLTRLPSSPGAQLQVSEEIK